MIYPSTVIKRRAAAVAALALLVFVFCLIGNSSVGRLRAVAEHPKLDLVPLLTSLSATSDATERQRLLAGFVSGGLRVLAAIILDPDDTIQAAYPGEKMLVGRKLRPPLPAGEAERSREVPEPPVGVVRRFAPDGNVEVISPFRSRVHVNSAWLQRTQVVNRVHSLLYEVKGEGPATEVRSARIYTRGEFSGMLYFLPRRDEVPYLRAATLKNITVPGAFFSFLVYSCMLALWVLLDARTRTDKAVPLAIFVLLTNFLGWLTYLVIRPESSRVCPMCITLLEPGFRLCPVCGWNAPSRCRQCHRPVRAHWHFCPYCETPLPEGVRDPLASDAPPAAPQTA